MVLTMRTGAWEDCMLRICCFDQVRLASLYMLSASDSGGQLYANLSSFGLIEIDQVKLPMQKPPSVALCVSSTQPASLGR